VFYNVGGPISNNSPTLVGNVFYITMDILCEDVVVLVNKNMLIPYAFLCQLACKNIISL
jgi:hypothetical protein